MCSKAANHTSYFIYKPEHHCHSDSFIYKIFIAKHKNVKTFASVAVLYNDLYILFILIIRCTLCGVCLCDEFFTLTVNDINQKLYHLFAMRNVIVFILLLFYTFICLCIIGV